MFVNNALWLPAPGAVGENSSAGGPDTSLRGSDPCAPDLVETKSFVERRGREGGERREIEGFVWGRKEGGRRGGGFSCFIAKSRETNTEHSFNQTVTSPPGAAQRLENRSHRGSLSRLSFCSHASRLGSAAQSSAGSDETVVLYSSVSEGEERSTATIKKK